MSVRSLACDFIWRNYFLLWGVPTPSEIKVIHFYALRTPYSTHPCVQKHNEKARARKDTSASLPYTNYTVHSVQYCVPVVQKAPQAMGDAERDSTKLCASYNAARLATHSAREGLRGKG